MKIRLPYGRGYLYPDIPDNRIKAVIEPSVAHFSDADDTVLKAMASPIESQRLEELVVNKNNVVIIASDHTRPVPSKHIIPHMISEIERGNPNASITILIATGCHRGTTLAELESKFGADIVAKCRIVIHSCDGGEPGSDTELVNIGKLPSGGNLEINRLAAEADLLISEGFIEPHFFAGFSGGRKSVLPGIASRKAVCGNHCSEFISSPLSRTGILDGNPVNRDMMRAAELAKLAYIVNVVLDGEKRVVAAFAGNAASAHRAGTEFVKSLCERKPLYSDIVITTNNGYPLDQNIYQAVKGMTAAEATCRDGGVIIMAAQCSDGVGGQSFYDTFANDLTVDEIYKKLSSVPQDKTVPDQWEAQIFARILTRFKVILVSEVDEDTVRTLRMIPAKSVEEALGLADKIIGKNNTPITVVPDGVSIIIR